jgi:hypothetical protein
MAHLRCETFPGLAAIPGFIRGSILHRAVEGGTEFQIVTVWASWEAVRAFAGADPEVAVVPPVVRAMMSDYDDRVVHYEIAETVEPDRWAVWRIDDNGNTFLVRGGLNRDEAEQLSAEFTARGHKQMYWVESEPRLNRPQVLPS